MSDRTTRALDEIEDAYQEMMSTPEGPDRIEAQERWLKAREYFHDMANDRTQWRFIAIGLLLSSLFYILATR